jgi:hypothetical protein
MWPLNRPLAFGQYSGEHGTELVVALVRSELAEEHLNTPMQHLGVEKVHRGLRWVAIRHPKPGRGGRWRQAAPDDAATERRALTMLKADPKPVGSGAAESGCLWDRRSGQLSPHHFNLSVNYCRQSGPKPRRWSAATSASHLMKGTHLHPRPGRATASHQPGTGSPIPHLCRLATRHSAGRSRASTALDRPRPFRYCTPHTESGNPARAASTRHLAVTETAQQRRPPSFRWPCLWFEAH